VKIRIFSALVVVAMLAACLSTMPRPEQGNKTLLAIVVKVDPPGTYGLAYDFGLKESKERLAVNPHNGVILFDKLAPGSYTIDRVYTTPGPGIGGGYMVGMTPEPRSIKPVTFTLKEGFVTILDVTLLAWHKETTPNSWSQGWQWVQTNRDEALAELAKYGNFDHWKVAP
jgi:hypothetical protein